MHPFYPTGRRRFGAFSSSADPEKLAARVQGIIIACSTAIIWFGMNNPWHKVMLTANDINGLAVAGGVVASSYMIVYGTVRKIAIWAIDKWNGRETADLP